MSYSKDEILEDMQRVANELEDPKLTLAQYDKHGKISPQTARRRFKTWNYAKSLINLDETKGGNRYTEKEYIQEGKRISKEFLDGNTINRQIFDEESYISIGSIPRRFGSFQNYADECGLEYERLSHEIPKEKLLEEIKSLKVKIEKVPSKEDMNEKGKYSVMPYRNKFGSYGNALEKCGFENNIPPGLNNEKDGTTRDFGKDWEEKREKTLQRDNYQCRICKYKGNRLSVHHIKPRYKFIQENNKEDMNKLSNLITLCPSCHGSLEGKFIHCTIDEFIEKARDALEITFNSKSNKIKESIFSY